MKKEWHKVRNKRKWLKPVETKKTVKIAENSKEEHFFFFVWGLERGALDNRKKE